MTIHTDNDTSSAQQDAHHPLDPLTTGEVERTTRILNASGRITPRTRIMAYSLLEPAKEVVLAFQPGQSVAREVFVVLRDHDRRLTIEAVVSLTEGTIRSWQERPDVQPALTYPEVFAAQQAILDHQPKLAASPREILAKLEAQDPVIYEVAIQPAAQPDSGGETTATAPN